ncbi:MAG: ligase-associated DNA damage response endonuclease PdeM [Saprospiraceae bacterium]|nr:ligase-associated DNA damage response endonuclease PdeM [Saprospiraceae bacterium]
MISKGPMTSLDTLHLEVAGHDFILHPHKVLFWPEISTLIVTDLHLGKIQHFREAGIYLPKPAAMDNYERLSSLLVEFAPQNLLMLGDLFHSVYNADWQLFCELRHTFSHIDFQLVKGNHDIMDTSIFAKNDMVVYDNTHTIDCFQFTHYPCDPDPGYYNLAGHLHPGVHLIGESRLSLKLPCFYFGRDRGLLPAFGSFTGISIIKPVAGDQVVVISEEQLAQVQ